MQRKLRGDVKKRAVYLKNEFGAMTSRGVMVL